jgi:hypothetical protein
VTLLWYISAALLCVRYCCIVAQTENTIKWLPYRCSAAANIRATVMNTLALSLKRQSPPTRQSMLPNAIFLSDLQRKQHAFIRTETVYRWQVIDKFCVGLYAGVYIDALISRKYLLFLCDMLCCRKTRIVLSVQSR